MPIAPGACADLIVAARAQIAAGALGTVESIRGTWNSPIDPDTSPEWKRRRAQGGGTFFETAANLFDLWRFLLHEEIAEIFAWSRDDAHGRHQDRSAGLVARFATGVVATAQVSAGTAHDISIEIAGDRGRTTIAAQRFDGAAHYAPHETSGMTGPRLRRLGAFLQQLPLGVARMRRRGDYGEAYRAMWHDFADCIRRERPPACTFADGREMLRGVLAAMQSASKHRPVAIHRAELVRTPIVA